MKTKTTISKKEEILEAYNCFCNIEELANEKLYDDIFKVIVKHGIPPAYTVATLQMIMLIILADKECLANINELKNKLLNN